MSDLANNICEACRVGAPRVTQEEIATLSPSIPDWSIVTVDGIDQLRRVFPFSNFVDALAFTNQVAEVAERAGHHPALLTEWGQVTVSWWTHKIKGLHRNDFIMAAKTDLLFR